MDKFLVEFIIFSKVLTYLFVITAGSCPSTGEVQYGVSLSGQTISSLGNFGLQMCIKECQTRARCKSIDFNRKDYICELKSKSLSEASTDVVQNSSIWHVDMKDWIITYNECSDISCQDGEKCVKKKCVPVECSSYPEIKNASPQSNNTRTFGTLVTYQCSNGYIGRGNQNVTCLSSGLWSQTTLTCYKTYGDWILLARFKSGIGVSTYDTWLATGNSSENDTSVEESCISFNYTATCTKHYRSGLIDEWSTLGVSEVKVELYTLGMLVANITFNGSETSKTNWFSRGNYLSSGWNDIDDTNQTFNYFSMEGHESAFRRFMIYRNYGGCSNDAGWMLSVERKEGCSWENAQNIPKFLYSPKTNACNYEADSEAADIMTVLIKATNFHN